MRPRNQHAEPRKPYARPRNLRPIVRHGLLIAIAALFVMPIVWMIAASLRQAGLPPPQSIELIPNPIALGNYARVFDLLPWGRYFLNSLIVVSAAVLELVTLTLTFNNVCWFAVVSENCAWSICGGTFVPAATAIIVLLVPSPVHAICSCTNPVQ